VATAKMPMSRAGDGLLRGGPAAGFTLIELLVVMTMIALIAALAAPMLQRTMPGLELRTAAESVQTELRLARSAAIRDNREAWLLVDLETGAYRRDGVAKMEVVPDAVQLSLLTARQEQVDAVQGRIRFFPDGTSTGGAVRLTRDGQRYEVAVDWFDGRITVDEIEAD